MSTGFMGAKLETGQVWKQVSPAIDYGDIIRWQVVFLKGVNAVVMNCATMEERVIYGQGQLDSFTFDCELTDEPPRLDQMTLKWKGY